MAQTKNEIKADQLMKEWYGNDYGAAITGRARENHKPRRADKKNAHVFSPTSSRSRSTRKSR